VSTPTPVPPLYYISTTPNAKKLKILTLYVVYMYDGMVIMLCLTPVSVAQCVLYDVTTGMRGG